MRLRKPGREEMQARRIRELEEALRRVLMIRDAEENRVAWLREARLLLLEE